MITTKEASEKWNISTRRIAKLAAEGRIAGSYLAGHSWLIPEDATKPIDARSKNGNMNQDHFIFPNVLIYLSKENPLVKFNSEEKELYNIYLKYENGDFEKGLSDANKLISKTKNIYISIGVLYISCFFNVILRRYKEAQKAVLRFYIECNKATEHTYELSFLLNDVYFFFEKNNTYKANYSINPNEKHSNFVYSYLSCQSLIQEMISLGSNTPLSINFNIHELNLIRLDKDGYEYLTMFYHYYLSSLYASSNNHEMELFHIKKSIDLAVKNNYYTSISGIMCYFPDLVLEVLEGYPRSIREKFVNLINLGNDTFAEYLAFSGNSIKLSQLTVEDFKIISYCLREKSIEEIAKNEDISVSKAKHVLVNLYRKLGVRKKADIREICSSVLFS